MTEYILSAQVARELTGQQKFIVRFQRQMPAPAFSHPEVKAEWLGFTLQGNRLFPSFGAAGRELTGEEVAELLSMIPKNESEFWAQYAGNVGLLETQANTDPQVICWPAEPIIGGKNVSQQSDEFVQKFLSSI